VSLTRCVIDDTLSQATFVSQTLLFLWRNIMMTMMMMLQFIDVMILMSVANVSMHASLPKKDILAFYVNQEYT